MEYQKSLKYCTPELMKLMMGPNPVKLAEELMENSPVPAGSRVCDLGSGKGLTSVFLAKEYDLRVYAADLWSEPEEHLAFFESMGVLQRVTPVKANAENLPFEKAFFDAIISVDSYHYFGRDPAFLDEKILPFVRPGGYVCFAVPGMKKDLHHDLPQSLLAAWSAEDLDTIHDAAYWRVILEKCRGAEVVFIRETEGNRELWDDWLLQENPYAVGDRRARESGGLELLNFLIVCLRKK